MGRRCAFCDCYKGNPKRRKKRIAREKEDEKTRELGWSKVHKVPSERKENTASERALYIAVEGANENEKMKGDDG